MADGRSAWLMDRLAKTVRIEIEPPETVDRVAAPPGRVVIHSPDTIRAIVSSLRLKRSGRTAIQACKVPPGYTVRFVTPKGRVETDLVLSGHKHLIAKGDRDTETVHYSVPAGFERLIRPYVLAIEEGRTR